ncbi:MAG TPA: TlpA disulfide reductase family protein [Niastella sp.]
MKKKLLFAILALALSGSALQSQAVKDTTSQYYYRLATSKDAADRALVTGKLYDLLQSNQEKDWMMAQQFFNVLKKKTTSDSVQAVIKTRFPGGQLWRSEELQTIYDAATAAEKEAAYKKWLKKYPVKKFEGSRILYDYAANSVARAFATEKNLKKALYYADQGQTPAWNGEAWAGVAQDLEKNGYVDEPALLYKKALENSLAFKTTRTKEEGAQFAASGYRGYCNSYARCLLLQKKPDSALVYIQKAYAEGKPLGYYNQTYVDVLMALGRDKEAYEKADEIVQTGNADKKLKGIHKDLYEKLNAGGKPYSAFMKEVEAEITRKVIANLKNIIVDKPGPTWELKDVNGNTVSSASLKGKTVVLDFWATWCGPCKRSFPAMQMAVNKFRDNPDVQFLFIHTWEKGEGDATAAAKKYVDDNKYSFRVLMDLKDEASGTNKVVEGFGIQGIPTKFVLDKNGNIRFKVTGFSGSDEAAVEELSAMIDMVK